LDVNSLVLTWPNGGFPQALSILLCGHFVTSAQQVTQCLALFAREPRRELPLQGDDDVAAWAGHDVNRE
jgi:hypothetical protein